MSVPSLVERFEAVVRENEQLKAEIEALKEKIADLEELAKYYKEQQ